MGILFVLQTGIPWEYLPQEMGCGSGMTYWRRLREWQEEGVWQRLHGLLLAKLHGLQPYLPQAPQGGGAIVLATVPHGTVANTKKGPLVAGHRQSLSESIMNRSEA